MLRAFFTPRRLVLFTLSCVLSSFFSILSSSPITQIKALETCSCPSEMDERACNESKLKCLQEKIGQKQKEASSLQNTISIMSGQIQIQELTITRTRLDITTLEADIEELSNRISGLNASLDELTGSLINHVQFSYKKGYRNSLELLLSSQSLDQYLIEQTYQKYVQSHLVSLMEQSELTRLSYTSQKEVKEQKTTELDQKRSALQSQQLQLDKQKKSQQALLSQTKSDEAQYQQELAKTLSELKAIQSIVSGFGNEARVRDVGAGDAIASIIPGASACSTGAHLHFEVVKDKSNRDPSGYLKSADITWRNSPDGPFGFSGGWEWPVNNPASLTQGYGMTWYAATRRAYGGAPHTGLDIKSKSPGDYIVKAVQPGTLYQGTIKCGKGLLRYVKVEHKADGLSTYYLHVNY